MIFNDEIKIKEDKDITSFDIAHVVDTVVDFMFRVDENGVVSYTPYYMERGFTFAVIAFLLDGVELEETDEDVLETAYADKRVAQAVDGFFTSYPELYNSMVEDVRSIVEFKKNEYLHHSSELNKLLKNALEAEMKVNDAAYNLAMQQIRLNEKSEEILKLMSPEEVAELNKRIASGELDPDGVANIAIEKYLATDKHDENLIQTIDEKNKKIQELQAYKDAHTQED